jgi:hypothetical protein
VGILDLLDLCQGGIVGRPHRIVAVSRIDGVNPVDQVIVGRRGSVVSRLTGNGA